MEVRDLYCDMRRAWTPAMGDDPGLLFEGARGDEFMGLCV
jgi:hypothetical protein